MKGAENVKAMVVTKELIELSWEPIPCHHQNGRILRYAVKYSGLAPSGNVEEYISETKDIRRTITLRNHIHPNTHYSVMVAGINDAGIGEYSLPEIVTTRGGLEIEST